MKGTSLLVVLLVAKLAMAWNHASTLTGWSLVAYTWQDVLVALAFAGLDGLGKRIGVTPRISWGLYWVLAIYAAINVPVARALSTPLTWPMIRSARGPLADSILLYVTPTNCLTIAFILLLAAVLPHLLRSLPQPHSKAWATCATIFVLLGLIARTRAETRGMDRNAVTALIDTALPRVTANAGFAITTFAAWMMRATGAHCDSPLKTVCGIWSAAHMKISRGSRGAREDATW